MNGTIVNVFTLQLPTAATWVYFSVLLAAALFFKFSRLLSIRNWDVFTLFLFHRASCCWNRTRRIAGATAGCSAFPAISCSAAWRI